MTGKEILEQGKKSGFEMKNGKAIGIDEFTSHLRNIFMQYLDADYVDSNFNITEMLKIWLETATGNFAYEDWVALYSGRSMIEGTKDYYEYHHELYKNQPYRACDGMYIMFGWWSDKHDLFYCCDKSSRYYGKIVDAYDVKPWPLKKFSPWEVYNSPIEILMEYEDDE